MNENGHMVAPEAVVLRLAMSIPEFCSAHRISRALFYILQRTGRGPRIMRVGRRTLVSAEAAAEWRRRMELEAQQKA